MPYLSNYLLTQIAYNQLLVNSVPDIKRCQEWYLFDYAGNKILDLYAANTRLMFGHTPLSVSMRIKQRINQGLLASIPVRAMRDFVSRCKQLFPAYRYFCFAPSLRDVFSTLSRHPYYRHAQWIDPALPPCGVGRTNYQRQSADIEKPQSAIADTTKRESHTNNDTEHHLNTNRGVIPSVQSIEKKLPTVGIGRVFCSIPPVDVLLPIIPQPDEGAPQLIATSDAEVYAMFCHSIIPSGVILAVLLEMVKYFESRHHHKSLRHTNRADYISPPLSTSDLPPSVWVLHERYLWSTLSDAQYYQLYRTMLANNILIHPNPHAPSILPFRLPKSDYLRFLQITATINKEVT